MIDSNDGDIFVQLLLARVLDIPTEGIYQLLQPGKRASEKVPEAIPPRVRDADKVFRTLFESDKQRALNACFVVGLLGTDYSRRVPIASTKSIADAFFKAMPTDKLIEISSTGVKVRWAIALNYCYSLKPDTRGAKMDEFFEKDTFDLEAFCGAIEVAIGNAAW